MKAELMIRLKIKEIAEARGINQGKLSRLADVGYSTIRRIFDDPYYSVNFTTLERIGKALNMPATELLEEVPDDQR
jgi:DNA-binding Xre family transcriptional regulator